MKRNVLSLSIQAMLGGLGFAGAAAELAHREHFGELVRAQSIQIHVADLPGDYARLAMMWGIPTVFPPERQS